MQDKCLEWDEGLAVLLACLIIGSIPTKRSFSFANSNKSSTILMSHSAEMVSSCRAVQASVNEVCVRDVVQLDTGAKIPAGISNYILLALSRYFVITMVQTVS